MDEPNDCDRPYVLGGATVYSHTAHYRTRSNPNYPDKIDCQLTFQAAHLNWKLMLVIEYLEIPDISYGLCNDAIYIYDAENVFGETIVSKRVFGFLPFLSIYIKLIFSIFVNLHVH